MQTEKTQNKMSSLPPHPQAIYKKQQILTKITYKKSNIIEKMKNVFQVFVLHGISCHRSFFPIKRCIPIFKTLIFENLNKNS